MERKINQRSLVQYGTLTKIASKKARIDEGAGKKSTTIVIDVDNENARNISVDSDKKKARKKLWQEEWLDRFKPWLLYDDKKVTDLSLRFQKDYVDVTTIHGIVTSTILCIKDEYLDERAIDLNAAQRGIGGYLIMPDYGSKNGYMHALRASLKGDLFFGQSITRDVEGVDLHKALDFQFKYAKKLCECLEKRFVDNSILHAIKILVPAQHPMHERLLKEYGNDECDKIASFYGDAKKVGHVSFAPIIDGDAFKVEFRKFKRQAGIDYSQMSLIEAASLLVNNATWKDVFPNISKFPKLLLFNVVEVLFVKEDLVPALKLKQNGGID
ncbi:hypothetical protein L7F22_035564 [Adiantum nelumboides]|nr:hypothetical protein [Adiantum nelumboides]